MSKLDKLIQALPPVLRKLRASVDQLKVEGIGLTATSLVESGVIDPEVAFVKLDHATKIEATIAAPVAGKYLVITQSSSGTAGHTVTLAAGVFNTAGNTIATFNAVNETLVLFGVSATRYVVVENIQAVGFSGP